MNKDEMSRHHRETRMRRMILMAAGGLAILIVLILGFGYWREYISRGQESVATVAGKSISIEDYARRLDFRRKTMDEQMAYMQAQLQAVSGNADLTNLVQRQVQQLQFSAMLLPEQTLDQMVAEELIRQEAARRGITVSQEEIDKQISDTFTDPTAAAPSPSPEAQAAAPVATPSASPAPVQDAQAKYAEFLATYGVRASDWRSLVEVQLLYDRLEKDMGASVPTSAEQVHARQILVDNEDKAKEISQKLKAGGNFEETAKAESLDTGSKDNGGDLGWFPRGVMVKEFEDAAFQLGLNVISDPVKSSFGWHIIQVLEKDPNRAVDPAILDQQRQEVISKWLDENIRGPQVTTNLTESNKNWVYQKIKWKPAA